MNGQGDKCIKVKLTDIIDAIEMMDQYTEYFLDKETGKIEWISDMVMTQKEQEEIYDRLDEHGFYRLPTSFEIRDYDIMEDFVDILYALHMADFHPPYKGVVRSGDLRMR